MSRQATNELAGSHGVCSLRGARKSNQDAAYADRATVVVADGVGSRPHGAEIAHLAVRSLVHRLAAAPLTLDKLVTLPASLADDLAAAEVPRLDPRAATCLAYAVVAPDRRIYLSAIGDCRVAVYQLVGHAWCLTSLVGASRTSQGSPTAVLRPGSHFAAQDEADVMCACPSSHAVIIATSDGCHEWIDGAVVPELIRGSDGSADVLARRMVQLALHNGSRDNVTAAALFAWVDSERRRGGSVHSFTEHESHL